VRVTISSESDCTANGDTLRIMVPFNSEVFTDGGHVERDATYAMIGGNPFLGSPTAFISRPPWSRTIPNGLHRQFTMRAVTRNGPYTWRTEETQRSRTSPTSTIWSSPSLPIQNSPAPGTTDGFPNSAPFHAADHVGGTLLK
jgi:hypothetical protein